MSVITLRRLLLVIGFVKLFFCVVLRILVYVYWIKQFWMFTKTAAFNRLTAVIESVSKDGPKTVITPHNSATVAVWRFVGFVSSIYLESGPCSRYLFTVFLVSSSAFGLCMQRVCQQSTSFRFKAHSAFLVLTITSVYSYFADKAVTGKPDAHSLISCAAFAIIETIVQRNLQLYKKSWNKVVEFLKLEKECVEPGTNAQSMKDSLDLFNMHFEEICNTQSTWFTTNIQLIADIIITLQDMLLPLYGIFIGKFQDVVGKQAHKYIKYGIFGIQDQLNDLFLGTMPMNNKFQDKGTRLKLLETRRLNRRRNT
ncbi:hypothetical protein VNO78_31314 [Psophocarpus tetragonolobus]|uniref:Exocyst subunit Exo70 family protein n=1 Tax=Psophocarpus tetragonolobus TaxID=3891 RepID=A0AAN9X733_PSOTE